MLERSWGLVFAALALAACRQPAPVATSAASAVGAIATVTPAPSVSEDPAFPLAVPPEAIPTDEETGASVLVAGAAESRYLDEICAGLDMATSLDSSRPNLGNGDKGCPRMKRGPE